MKLMVNRDMPQWMFALLEGFGWDKLSKKSLDYAVGKIKAYVSENKLSLWETSTKVEKNINIVEQLLDVLNDVDYKKLEDGRKAKEFRIFLYEIFKQSLEG